MATPPPDCKGCKWDSKCPLQHVYGNCSSSKVDVNAEYTKN